jgi:lysophospholipase L1-like esterase
MDLTFADLDPQDTDSSHLLRQKIIAAIRGCTAALQNGVGNENSINILRYGAAADGVTDDTAALAAAILAAGSSGTVRFPAKPAGQATTYYFAGTTNLTGAILSVEPGVTLSVNQTTGILYRNIRAASDFRLTVRAKSKTYIIPKNEGDFSLYKRNVNRSTYTSAAALSFLTDFTTATMNYNSATPSAPGTAPTTTANKYTIETATVATTVYSGPWIRPKVGQRIDMSISTLSAQASGNAQAVICDSTGSEYCGVELIDYSNGLKSLTYEVNLIRMTGGTRTRIARKAVRDRNWMIGHNGSTGCSAILGVKMVAPNEAEFFVNNTLVGRLALNSGNNADRIHFGLNGTYSGAANGFYDPVSFEDRPGSEQRPLRIAVFGDSLPAGSSTTLPWPELLAHFLEGAEGIGCVTVDNYAVSGHTAADQTTVMNTVTLTPYQLVIVAVGINDTVQGVTADTFDANLAYLITHAQAAGCAVIVSLPTMFSAGSTNDVRGGIIRGRCQRVALLNNARVADPLNLIGDCIDTMGVGDLIHPNIQGQVIHAQAVAREIVKLYANDQPTLLGKIRRVNGSILTQGTAAPTTGYFLRGDKVENTTPSASGYSGWVCVTSGSPGTWKGYGLIET